MPRGGYTIGQGIADAGRAIGGGLANKWAVDDEKKRREAQHKAILREAGVGPDDPLYRESANMDTQALNSALRQREAKAEAEAAADAFMQSKRQDLDINLANRAVEDPNATRGNLDLGPKMPQDPMRPQFNMRQSPSQAMSGEKPNPAMTGRLSDIQSGTPAITRDERANVLRSELRPGDEGLAGIAGRSRAMAEDRKKADDLRQEAERMADLWEQARSGQPLEGETLNKAGLPLSQSLEHSGKTLGQIQAPKPPEPKTPSFEWSFRHDAAIRKGLKPNTPEYDDFMLKTPEDKPDVSNAKVAEVWNTVYQRILSGRDDAASPYYNMEIEKVRPMADSLSQIAVEGMSAAVEGNQPVPDDQAQDALNTNRELKALIQEVKSKIGKK